MKKGLIILSFVSCFGLINAEPTIFSNKINVVKSEIRNKANTLVKNALSLGDNKKNDDYDYEFQSGVSFENNNGDEFERNNVENGINSASISYDENGGIISQKRFGESIDNSISPLSYNDSFEDNDSFANATTMYSAGQDPNGVYIHSVWCDATISQKTSGWWLWEKKYIDKDFYSFDMVSVGTLTVTLTNIPSGCDYDIRLYRLENGKDANCNNLSFDKSISVSNFASNSNEKIQISAFPGTYYACVYSFQDKTFNNDLPYTIKFEEQVNLNRDNVYYNISDGRNSGDLGALWISDYKPLGITPVTIKNSNSKQEITNYDTYPYIKHLADRYTNDAYINYAVLYVWNLETRATISALAASLVDIVDRQTDWDSNQEKQINIGMNSAGLFLAIAGSIVGVVSAAVCGPIAVASLAAAGFIINAASLPLSFASFAMCFQTNTNSISSKKDLLAYLVSMQQTFSVGRGSNENEVKVLKYRYRFNNNNGRYLNWSPFYSSTDYNFYNENTIGNQIEHSGIDGTVKGFKNYSDIEDLLNK